jgi:Carboxypeptidase regulatory-like domain
MMRRLVPLIVTLLSLACGNEPTSPSSSLQLPTGPALPPGVPNGPPSTMRGEVWDTRNLPISGGQVQVVAPSLGPVVVTDASGQFQMPWPFAGTVTVRVSKEGFHPRERSVPEPGAPRYPVHLGFELEAIDAPVIVAGIYDITFTAANECTQLPTVARQRMYRGQVGANGRGRFSATIFNIEPIEHAYFWAEVRGEPPQTLRVQVVTEPAANPAIGFVERIEPGIFLEITGSADFPLGAQSAAALFDGTFALCRAEVAVSYETPYHCPVPPTTCRSANHRLAWMRQ